MYLLNINIATYCNIYALTKLFAIGDDKEKKRIQDKFSENKMP